VIRRWLFVLVMTASVVLPFLPTPPAQAFAGRAAYEGYFQGTFDDEGSFVLSSGIYPNALPLYNGKPYTADFITKILGYANGPTGRNKTGAEFIILTMLGYNAGTPQGTRANALNPATQTAWVNAVHFYSDNGWIRWGVPDSWTINTYWQGDNGGGPEPNDDAWYPEVGSFPDTIQFHDPSSPGFYVIKQNCANPLGNLSALSQPDFDVTLSANGNPPTVIAGHTYGITATLHNNGPAASQAGTLQVMYPGASVCSPSPGCPLSQGFVPVAGITAKGFRGASAAPFPPGANWFWSVKSMAVNATETANMQWTVSPAAAPLTVITFNIYYAPYNLAGAVRHVTLTFTVVSERTPAVVGVNGDIHAGGGLCGGAPTSGSVKGYPGAGSGGQYVVSASLLNGINDFTSNGTGVDNLKIGKTGAYLQACRQDLVKAALAYEAAGAGFATFGSSNVDVGTLGAMPVYIYKLGGTLRLHGTIHNKVTIFAESGSVLIDGTVALDAAVHGVGGVRDEPSLGIIAANDISIAAAVPQVDAYLFANGAIDTCPEGNVAATKIQCSHPGTLTVNGFLMAHTIAFHRLGAFNTDGSAPAETVVLNPEIYLNPPTLFDGSIDDTSLQGQGERQPLF